eukprot:3270918-Pleurochrysis_carterae.AAC.1
MTLTLVCMPPDGVVMILVAVAGFSAVEAQPKLVLVAYAGSATDSHHSLNAPVVRKTPSNVHNYVGQIKGWGGPKLSCLRTVWEWVRCTHRCSLECLASLLANNTVVQ